MAVAFVMVVMDVSVEEAAVVEVVDCASIVAASRPASVKRRRISFGVYADYSVVYAGLLGSI